MQMITQATRTIKRRITDLSPYFFLIFLFEINRLIDQSSRVCTRLNVHKNFFLEKKKEGAVTQLFDDKKKEDRICV
jgi:hypothetical protein